MDFPKKLQKSLSYSGKCNDYDSSGNIDSPLFNNATDMAQVVEDTEVFDLSFKEFQSLLSPHEDFIAKGHKYQINLKEGIAWVYNEHDDIHYFYSL